MTKQAKEAPAMAQKEQNQLKSQELDLQMRFSKMTSEQRLAVGNYLNAYNLAAWIYNELIDEDCRIYIDLAMKYTMETQALAKSMKDISDDPKDVEHLVNKINHGE
jgi:hypothetical protein